MVRCLRGISLAAFLLAAPLSLARLPDSGQTTCYDSLTPTMSTCADANTGDAATYPRQDGRFGRDPDAAAGNVAKIGGGAAGFDYTKISNGGRDLPAGAALGSNPGDWACTRDNITGLTWEVKLNNNMQLRHMGWNYSWLNNDPNTNGGDPGVANNGFCLTPGPACDTPSFTAAVNAAALCGATDWRLPNVRELATLVNFGASSPSIDTTYFPNTASPSAYLSSDTFLYGGGDAVWYVDFKDGSLYGIGKATAGEVRLVRGNSF